MKKPESRFKMLMRWSMWSRLDSRNLLKFLIIFNLILAIYQITSLHFIKPESCLPVKSSALESNGNLKSIHFSSTEHGLTSRSQDTLNVINSPRNLKAKSSFELSESNYLRHLSNPALSSQSKWWTIENRTSYTVIKNYIPSENINLIDPDSVTLSTQGTYEFLYHVENLCKRWDGPLSVAVYAPGEDFLASLHLIGFMGMCCDRCVRQNVSWHMIYDMRHGPKPEEIKFPAKLINYSEYDCSTPLEQMISSYENTYRSGNKLPYPINVARNVARLSVKTKYLLASDIELYPSLNIVSMFKKLLERERSSQVPNINPRVPHVYVLPIFEVNTGLNPPLTKVQLNHMMKKKEAIFFHYWVCDACQNFPDRKEWIDAIPADASLNIFRVTQRLRSRSSWEPLYIGTNAEPLYEERLTWDGKKDKMSQMFEMCLLNYDLLILDNAFLVHAPGIKRIDMKDQQKRLPFIKLNERTYKTIVSKLVKKYKSVNNRTLVC
ncbi:beta-1,4-glucuronyltransferase 1-like [Brevipalpus obovatus]|uniref:beta-1,4-glucuronyltransferase 1-like n=1 Tax=Brevipalpus obovatus TaxID=246614 RepID=UPI003D9EBE75